MYYFLTNLLFINFRIFLEVFFISRSAALNFVQIFNFINNNLKKKLFIILALRIIRLYNLLKLT